jgi:hypothetical protein
LEELTTVGVKKNYPHTMLLHIIYQNFRWNSFDQLIEKCWAHMELTSSENTNATANTDDQDPEPFGGSRHTDALGHRWYQLMKVCKYSTKQS